MLDSEKEKNDAHVAYLRKSDPPIAWVSNEWGTGVTYAVNSDNVAKNCVAGRWVRMYDQAWNFYR